MPGHRIHIVWPSLSSSWPKAGTFYSFPWSEYSLSDFFDARSEGPSSPTLKEIILVLLCLGDRWLPSYLSAATTLRVFLGEPFLTSLFPLSSWTQSSSLKMGSPSHFLMSSPWSWRKNQSSSSGLHLGFPFFLTKAGQNQFLGLPLKPGLLVYRDVKVYRVSSTFCTRRIPSLQLMCPFAGNTVIWSCWNMIQGFFEPPSSPWSLWILKLLWIFRDLVTFSITIDDFQHC